MIKHRPSTQPLPATAPQIAWVICLMFALAPLALLLMPPWLQLLFGIAALTLALGISFRVLFLT